MKRKMNELLDRADAAARQGDWENALAILQQAGKIDPVHTGMLNGQGTCLIQLGRIEEAVTRFQKVATLAPESPEVYNNLGVALSLCGQTASAETAYKQAIALDPDHAQAWKNLALVYLKQDRLAEGVKILAWLVKSNPQDSEALLLLAQCYEEGEDYASARHLYSEALKIQPDHPQARDALRRLPAVSTDQERGTPRAESSLPRSVVFYGTGEVSDSVRLLVPAKGLARDGWRVKVSRQPVPEDFDNYTTFVFSRPQLSPQLMDALAACTSAGKYCIVDLDDDFHHLPTDHPGYQYVGPGNTASLHKLETAIRQASLLTVATPILAERYASFAHRVIVIPNGWNCDNPLWDKPAPRRRTINIGWAGTPTHRQDVALVRQGVIRVMRETPDAVLVIGGDPAVYEMFSSLPVSRCMFLPMASYDDYPFMLAHFDILLAPLRDNEFNQAKSDIKLVEAGARRIPWVASPLPAYRAWNEGGLCAENSGEWYTALKQLVGNAALRKSLGEAGRQKAEGRESIFLARLWQEVVSLQNM